MPLRPVRLRNFVAYGLNDFLGAGAMSVISGWIIFFYTTFCGLTPVQATAIFTTARLLDAVASPLFGFLSDRLYRYRIGRRFGRRRFFVLASIPLLPSFAFMWVDGHSFWYYLVTYVFFEVVYAMELIPYETLAAEMSPDYKVKAKFAGARILCGQIAAILAGFLPRVIESFGRNSAQTFFYMGAIFAVIFMLVAFTVHRFSWERTPEEVERHAPATSETPGAAVKKLYSDLLSTFRIRAFRLHLGMYLGAYVSQDVFNAVFTLFVIFALSSTQAVASTLLGAMATAQLVAVIAFIPLVLAMHPAPSYRLAVSLFGGGILLFAALYYVAPSHLLLWIYVPVIVSGLGRGGLNYIPWNTYNYMADVDEIVTGRRREGAYAGVMTFVRKTMQALAVMLVGVALQWGGFVSGGQTQSEQAIHTMLFVMCGVTIAILGIGAIVSLHFRLDKNTHAVLMNEIERLKQGSHSPTGEARSTVEDLSGFAYENLWGRNSVAK